MFKKISIYIYLLILICAVFVLPDYAMGLTSDTLFIQELIDKTLE